MAYAQLAGLPPYYGLYASFLPVAIASLFGSSRQLATGPVAVVSLLTAAALEPIASNDPSGYVAYAVMLALLVGLFQLSLGLLRMGVLVDFFMFWVQILNFKIDLLMKFLDDSAWFWLEKLKKHVILIKNLNI